jgi:hypothetical protein
VQINQNQTHSPNPVGAQAPNAPVGDLKGSEHRPQSRAETVRESLKAAFDRAQTPPPKPSRPVSTDKPAAKAAEAKPGHNNPPEETPKLDLKKRPTDQPSATEQPRDRGRFAPRATNDQQNVATNAAEQVAQANQQQAQPYKRLPPHAPYAEPPGRIAEHARREWADTPESVRGEVHRMNHEFGRAVQHYRGAAEAFQPIAKFHQMAQQHGTTLETALTNYTSMEQKLRSDPLAGLDLIVNNLGLTDPATGKRIDLRDIAYTVLSQSPEQLRMLQQGNQQNAASKQIGSLHQEVSGLKQALNQMHTERQFAQTRSVVDQYAASHPRLDELAEVIKREINLGFDLDTAYRRAELLFPATHAAQTRTPPAQTRPTDRSIHGAPDVTGSNPASRRSKEASPTPRAALQNAMSRLNGAH